MLLFGNYIKNTPIWDVWKVINITVSAEVFCFKRYSINFEKEEQTTFFFSFRANSPLSQDRAIFALVRIPFSLGFGVLFEGVGPWQGALRADPPSTRDTTSAAYK